MYHKWQSYDVWFLRYWAQWTKFFVILDHFLPFYPHNNPKNQSFEKMKKNTWRYIILHMRTINESHMMYGSWDMKFDGQDFLSFLTVFCPFTVLTTQKIKILKNWKKTTGDIIILHKCSKNHDHMLYCSLDMAHNRCKCYFSLWATFCPFTSLATQKIKIFKKMKKSLEIS